jgi:hypothetical protein
MTTTKTYIKNPQLEQTAATLAYALGLGGRCVKRAVESHSVRVVKDTDRIFQLTQNGKTVQGFLSAKEISQQLSSGLDEVKEFLVKPRGLKTKNGTYSSVLKTPFEFEKGKAK